MNDRLAPSEEEIAITSEMIEEGELALTEYDCEFEGRDVAVCRIFRRMLAARDSELAN
jgi:hypothetical protein